MARPSASGSHAICGEIAARLDECLDHGPKARVLDRYSGDLGQTLILRDLVQVIGPT